MGHGLQLQGLAIMDSSSAIAARGLLVSSVCCSGRTEVTVAGSASGVKGGLDDEESKWSKTGFEKLNLRVRVPVQLTASIDTRSMTHGSCQD